MADEFDDFFNHSLSPDEMLLNTDNPGQGTYGDMSHDQDQVIDNLPHLQVEKKESDVPFPSVEVQDTQEESQLPSQEATAPLLPSQYNFFGPSNITSTHSTSKPNFFNPSTTGPSAPPPRSIFGPPVSQGIEQIKGENVEDNRDNYAPVTPHRESKTATPIRPKQTTLVTSNGKFTIAPRKASKPEKVCSKKVNMDDSSDGDLKIIEASQASATAKTKWAEPRTFIEIPDDDPVVKSEPKEKEPTFRLPNHLLFPKPLPQSSFSFLASDMPAILAKQRALLNKNKLCSRDSHGMNGPRRDACHEAYETSPRTNNNKRRRLSGQIVQEDPEQVDAAMRADSGEDDSWMHEEPEGDDDAELHQLQIKFSKLSRREANGKINEQEIIELGRVRKQLMLKQRLAQCARGDPTRQPVEESLFVPADQEEILQRKRLEHKQRAAEQNQHAARKEAAPDSEPDDGEGDGDDTGGRNSPEGTDEAFSRMLQDELDGEGLEGILSENETVKKPKKPRKKVVKTAREFFMRQQEEQREKDRKKAQKQKAKGGKGGKAAAKGKAAGKKGKGAGLADIPQAPARRYDISSRSGIDEIGQRMINDLMNNDPIADRLQNPIFDVDPEPEMQGANKKSTQLQRLLANIPEGSSDKGARSDKAKLQQASRSFGFAKVKAVDGKWLIKGMKSTLYHHQLLGAQWMIERELSDEAPFGGLLADGMGLGKTVQTLACMVGNPPSERDRLRGVNATLIVVPSSVIEQWLDEIRNHTEIAKFPKIMRYKASAKIPIEVLRDLDIVVCSYQEVMRQFPFPDQKDRDLIANTGYKKWWKKASRSMGDLYKIYWYRVVLDEAHAIKNNSARTSLACQNLRSIFRWCLTGTPLLNRLEE